MLISVESPLLSPPLLRLLDAGVHLLIHRVIETGRNRFVEKRIEVAEVARYEIRLVRHRSIVKYGCDALEVGLLR